MNHATRYDSPFSCVAVSAAKINFSFYKAQILVIIDFNVRKQDAAKADNDKRQRRRRRGDKKRENVKTQEESFIFKWANYIISIVIPSSTHNETRERLFFGMMMAQVMERKKRKNER